MSSRPRIGYVLLWFPLASETFIFREINQLSENELNLPVYTLYGKAFKGCSFAMQEYTGPVFRMGIYAFLPILRAFFAEMFRNPVKVWNLMRLGLFRRMRNLESQAENTWSFFAGFLLAVKCKEDNISLLHAPWANGPATAAWIASHISGVPFSFTGRAGDIYPPDGLLEEKSKDAVFIRTNNFFNVNWLKKFCPAPEKIKLIYNGLNFAEIDSPAPRNPKPPYKILSIGRFARTKGFDYLLTTLARLQRENFNCHLTLVGDGSWRRKLVKRCKRLNLTHIVEFTGFIPNDQLKQIMLDHDVLVVPSVVHSNGDRDGIPNVIMEACSFELPVIATDVCGISEVICNNETGYLVTQRDSRALSIAIRDCLENYAYSKKMAKSARQKVLKMFNTTQNALMLKELYLKAGQEK